MKRFEYHVFSMKVGSWHGGVKVDTDALTEEINRLGAAGWELVSTVNTSQGGSTWTVILIFKREKL